MKTNFKIFAIVIMIVSCSKNEQFKTIEIGNQVWSASDINIPINDDKHEIVLENGGRLYSKKGAEIAASKVKGWRLPSEKDMKSLDSNLSKNAEKFKNNNEVEKYFHEVFDVKNYIAERKGNKEPEIISNKNPNSKSGSFWLSDQEYKRDDVYNSAISLGQNIDKNSNKIRYKTTKGQIKSVDHVRTYLSVRLIKDDSSISENYNEIDGFWRTKKSFKGYPMEVVTVKVKGKSIFVKIDPKGRSKRNSGMTRSSVDEVTGKFISENKYELSNGLLLEYNKELDILYLKSPYGGEEYYRFK